MTHTRVQIGGPGTGKTHFLQKQCAEAAARYGLDKVLVVSLTRAGAKEIASRADLPPQQIGTIHSMASRALGSPTLAESKIKEWNEAYPDLPLSSHSATAEDGYSLQDELTPADRALMVYSNYRTMDRRLALMKREVLDVETLWFAERWDDWKKQSGYLDFVDLIETAITDCDTAPGQPAVIFNDEGQDTGRLEMRLLTRWAGSCD